MKVMISQPMSGLEIADIKSKREPIIRKFKDMGMEVVDNLFDEDISCSDYINPELYYLALSIDCIGQVEAVCFAEGWETSKECRIERKIWINHI